MIPNQTNPIPVIDHVLKLLVNQSGTNAPTVTHMIRPPEGALYVASTAYNDVGQHQLTLNTALDIRKTAIEVSNVFSALYNFAAYANVTDNMFTDIIIETILVATQAYTNGKLYYMPLTITTIK